MLKRLIDLALAALALMLAAIAIRAISLGVDFADAWQFPILVAAPVLIACGIAFSFRRSPQLRANLALLAFTSAGAVWSLEAVLQARPDPPPPSLEDVARARGAAFDGREAEQVALDLRAEGVHAYVTVPANTLRNPAERGGANIRINGRHVIPLANVRNRVVVHCNEGGRFTVFQTDERGYNNPPGLWTQPVDIAGIGDSFVQGACVDSSETLLAGVRRSVPRTLAVALDDFGPLSMLGALKEYLPATRPQHVFWFYFEWNDLRDLSRELAVDILREYMSGPAAQQLEANAAAIDTALLAFIDRELAAYTGPRKPAAPFPRSRRGAIVEWIKLTRLREAFSLDEMSTRVQLCCDLRAFESILREAKTTVESWGGQLHFVYLPAALRYQRPMSRVLDDAIRARRRVLRTVGNLGIPIVDVHRDFTAAGDPARFFHGFRSHYNPEGYRVAADAVLRHLERSR